MFKRSANSQKPKSRLSQVRGVLLLMVTFVIYFSMSKSAFASGANNVLAVSPVAASQEFAPVLSGDEKLAVDESVPLSCEDCDDGEADLDSSGLDMDEFIATLPHLNILILVSTYDIEDMHLSIPPFSRGLDYPPDARV